jgi:hypothetical protein
MTASTTPLPKLEQPLICAATTDKKKILNSGFMRYIDKTRAIKQKSEILPLTYKN